MITSILEMRCTELLNILLFCFSFKLHSYFSLTNEETDSKRLSTSPKVTQLVNS